MASEESKLLALYRLDFYKRKKNWKLTEDLKKLPPISPNIINDPNKSCDIVEEFPEPEFEVEQVSPHNKAFLEKSDDSLEPQLPDDEALKSQLHDGRALEAQLPDDGALEPQLPDDGALEPHLSDDGVLEPQLSDDGAQEPQLPDDGVLEPQLPDCGALEPQLPDDDAPSLPPPKNMYRPASSAEQARWGDAVDSLQEESRQYWCGAKDKGVREELACDQHDGARYQDSLWRPGLCLYDPASQLELNPAVDPLGSHLEYLTPEQTHQIAGEWLALHNSPVKQEECADTYDDYRFESGTADFMRGSHYAPHSTEIDLSITQECGCMCNNLYGLPVRKLAQAIRRHHSALTALLREQALRETLYPQSLQHHPPPEEFPMRDTNPLRPDVVLSGSHSVPSATGYEADTGRGRGRLQQHRLVGIQMGRPYWKVNEIVE